MIAITPQNSFRVYYDGCLVKVLDYKFRHAQVTLRLIRVPIEHKRHATKSQKS